MILTGFTDEASSNLAEQIRVTEELGWDYLSLRTIGNGNAHEISEEEFSLAFNLIQESGIKVAEFGTLIGNWAKSIHDDWKITLNEIERCIPRMHMLNVKFARIMSYAQEPWGQDQYPRERIKRLKEIVRIFKENGLVALHENCMNYGGFSSSHTLELLHEIPDLKLVFDTGNPVFQLDRSKAQPYPWQDSLAFYRDVKDAILHIHIKDAKIDDYGNVQYCFAGEGDGYITEILSDLLRSNYKGFIAIEPHMGKVFHEDNMSSVTKNQYEIYFQYGQKLELLVANL